jgi:hypothetical protein
LFRLVILALRRRRCEDRTMVPAPPDEPSAAPSEPLEPTVTQELALEPVQFIARTDAVLRLGSLMLGAGASSARVRDSMVRAAERSESTTCTAASA